jgi:integral membrane protein (TIGR01906 family)
MKIVHKVLSWMIALTVPVIIVLLVVRLLINPWFLQFEYHTPGFPADPYGFTLQDRLYYARFAANYLVNSEDISYLGDLRFPPGQQAPQPSCQYMTDCTHFYNDRELEHMLDVKNVLHSAMNVLVIGIVLLIALAIWAWLGKWQDHYLLGLQRGGIMVLVLLGIIIIFAVVAFNYIFVLFHEIFFKAGTWSFLYSDSLIRLFPERFWQDCFLMIGGLSIALGLLVYFIVRRVRIRRYLNAKSPPA